MPPTRPAKNASTASPSDEKIRPRPRRRVRLPLRPRRVARLCAVVLRPLRAARRLERRLSPRRGQPRRSRHPARRPPRGPLRLALEPQPHPDRVLRLAAHPQRRHPRVEHLEARQCRRQHPLHPHRPGRLPDRVLRRRHRHLQRPHRPKSPPAARHLGAQRRQSPRLPHPVPERHLPAFLHLLRHLPGRHRAKLENLQIRRRPARPRQPRPGLFRRLRAPRPQPRLLVRVRRGGQFLRPARDRPVQSRGPRLWTLRLARHRARAQPHRRPRHAHRRPVRLRRRPRRPGPDHRPRAAETPQLRRRHRVLHRDARGHRV